MADLEGNNRNTITLITLFKVVLNIFLSLVIYSLECQAREGGRNLRNNWAFLELNLHNY